MKITRAKKGFGFPEAGEHTIAMLQGMLDAGFVKFQRFAIEVQGYNGYIIHIKDTEHWYMVNIEES